MNSNGPIVHFAAHADAEEQVQLGPSLCQSGRAWRTENEQYVSGDWTRVDCKNCQRLLKAHNAREKAEEFEDDRKGAAHLHQDENGVPW